MTLKDDIATLGLLIEEYRADATSVDTLHDACHALDRTLPLLELLASLTPEQLHTYAQAQRREAHLARLYGATSSDPAQWEAIACAATTAAQLFELVGRES